MQTASSLSVLIRQLRLESAGVLSVELERDDGAALPAYEAGAHVDVHLPGAGTRSYSLVGAPGAFATYHLGIKCEADGRGGSRWFHESARVGDRLEISPPKNDFRLAEEAPHSVFIAGGIGITPLLSMIGRLASLGRSWELHFAARDRRSMPFEAHLEQHAATGSGRVVKHFSAEGQGRPDIQAIVGSAAADAHLYCCGPTGMIDAFVEAARHRSPDTVHYERFASAEAPATEGGFTLQLARDGRCFDVPPGKSILDVLLEAGVDVPYSCMQGVCGSCRLSVIEGQPDHRDGYLSDNERAANDALIPCCSGSLSPRLVVDL
ncbi:oxidoreductase [Ramlibacter henchirensis]|uniref:Oxidoreductase n=1 Tax=Ramlibacter henchirensis TaxID=204072 RepID=A0A4Z0BWW7_9BURK|nr:PDR/VanB family oxidoreductase [Ramlibacter henchirensis]TFZ02850.1 oxidoreductase [Ramlibacter henchirensis]